MAQYWNQAARTARRSDTALEERRAAREQNRTALIGEVVRELADRATHEVVARRTGIPIGFLTWAYPTVEDLRTGRCDSAART